MARKTKPRAKVVKTKSQETRETKAVQQKINEAQKPQPKPQPKQPEEQPQQPEPFVVDHQIGLMVMKHLGDRPSGTYGVDECMGVKNMFGQSPRLSQYLKAQGDK